MREVMRLWTRAVPVMVVAGPGIVKMYAATIILRAADMARDQRSRLVAIAGTLMVACSSAPTAPSPAATIRIWAFGVDPREVRIERWNYVMFVNADSRPHTIVSDPVDLHTQCPVLNRVGVILPGGEPGKRQHHRQDGLRLSRPQRPGGRGAEGPDHHRLTLFLLP